MNNMNNAYEAKVVDMVSQFLFSLGNAPASPETLKRLVTSKVTSCAEKVPESATSKPVVKKYDWNETGMSSVAICQYRENILKAEIPNIFKVARITHTGKDMNGELTNSRIEMVNSPFTWVRFKDKPARDTIDKLKYLNFCWSKGHTAWGLACSSTRLKRYRKGAIISDKVEELIYDPK